MYLFPTQDIGFLIAFCSLVSPVILLSGNKLLQLFGEKLILGISYTFILPLTILLTYCSSLTPVLLFTICVLFLTILSQIAALSLIQKCIADPLQDYYKAVICCTLSMVYA